MIERMPKAIVFILISSAAEPMAIAQVSDIGVPEQVDYSGVLFQSDGVSPRDADQDIYVRIFENEDDDNGDESWSEAFEDTQLRKGAYVLQLGDGKSISNGSQGDLSEVFAGSLMWLGVTLNDSSISDNSLKAIASVPYAFTANQAESAVNGVPPGTISIWCGTDQSGNGVPEGWLLCDGSPYSESAYPNLFAAIGETWNTDSVEDDFFNVPNFGGRALMGVNSDDAPGENTNSSLSYDNASDEPSFASLTNHALADLIGEEKHLLKVSELPSHSHSYDDKFADDSNRRHRDPGNATPKPHRGSDSRTRTTEPTGGDMPHNNNQPSRVVTYIIKY